MEAIEAPSEVGVGTVSSLEREGIASRRVCNDNSGSPRNSLIGWEITTSAASTFRRCWPTSSRVIVAENSEMLQDVTV